MRELVRGSPLRVLDIVAIYSVVATINHNLDLSAFPMQRWEEYCTGYHAGAIQADKDDNASRNLDVFQHRCTATTQQYCQGFVNGYNDEASSMIFLKLPIQP